MSSSRPATNNMPDRGVHRSPTPNVPVAGPSSLASPQSSRVGNRHIFSSNDHTSAKPSIIRNSPSVVTSQQVNGPSFDAIRDHTLNWVASHDVFDGDCTESLTWLAREELRHRGLKVDRKLLQEISVIFRREALRRQLLRQDQLRYGPASRAMVPASPLKKHQLARFQEGLNSAVQLEADQDQISQGEVTERQTAQRQAAQYQINYEKPIQDKAPQQQAAQIQVAHEHSSHNAAFQNASAKNKAAQEERAHEQGIRDRWEMVEPYDFDVGLEDESETLGDWCLVDKAIDP